MVVSGPTAGRFVNGISGGHVGTPNRLGSLLPSNRSAGYTCYRRFCAAAGRQLGH
jgi:hypothetical protein